MTRHGGKHVAAVPQSVPRGIEYRLFKNYYSENLVCAFPSDTLSDSDLHHAF